MFRKDEVKIFEDNKELLENAGKLSHDFMINYIDKQYNNYKKQLKEEKDVDSIRELEEYLDR